MTIAYVLKKYPRYSETFIVTEILAHEKAGYDVRIYSLNPPGDTHFQDIISRVKAPVEYLSTKAERAGSFWERLSKVSDIFPNLFMVLANNTGVTVNEAMQATELAIQVENNHITHLHAHFASTATTVARLASAITGVPYSFTAHAKDIFHEDNDFVALKRKFDDAAGAITVSDFNLRYLRQDLGVCNSNLVRVYNGLDLHDFEFSSPLGRPAKILAVGRLVEKKGFSDLVSACRILTDRGLEFTCQIAGTGEFESKLKQQIIELDLSDVVAMLGARPQAEIKKLISNAAMLAAPCIVGEDGNRDGLPTVLLEAMALGTPCISTDTTGIPEVLIHEETGLMVPQNNPEKLADAMQRLLDDREFGLKLAQNARHLIEANFNIHQNATEIRSHFKGLNGAAARSSET